MAPPRKSTGWPQLCLNAHDDAASCALGRDSSVVWPLVVVCIPAGITFYSARLYAEAAPPPRDACDAGSFTVCADAAALDYCATATCTGPRCACAEQICSGGASASPRLGCHEVLTCEVEAANRAACDGIPIGSPCMAHGEGPGSGTCMSERCLATSDAGFVGTPQVLCRSHGATLTSGSNANPPAPSTDDAGASARREETSGCAAAGGSGPALLLGLPVALGLLLGRRRVVTSGAAGRGPRRGS